MMLERLKTLSGTNWQFPYWKQLGCAEDFIVEFTHVTWNQQMKRTTIFFRNFQSDVGLKPTGTAGQTTVELMKRPRCGTPSLPSRKKRFGTSNFKLLHVSHQLISLLRSVPHNYKWPRTALTWKLTDPYNKLSLSDIFVMRLVWTLVICSEIVLVIF